LSEKSFINEIGRSKGHVQRGSKRPPGVFAHQPSQYFLTPLSAPSTSSTKRSPENTVEEPEEPEQVDEEISK
jgi:hypothetical protein